MSNANSEHHGRRTPGMITLDDDELRTWFGFGVAGNFAGHLEQAGEAADFANVASEGAADSQATSALRQTVSTDAPC